MLFHFTGDSGYFTLGLGPLANPVYPPEMEHHY